MRKTFAHILLVVFSTFLICLSGNYSSYLKMLNTGADTKDVSSVPEEHHDSPSKLKHEFKLGDNLHLTVFDVPHEYYVNYRFLLSENIYFDVPHSPPDPA